MTTKVWKIIGATASVGLAICGAVMIVCRLYQGVANDLMGRFGRVATDAKRSLEQKFDNAIAIIKPKK